MEVAGGALGAGITFGLALGVALLRPRLAAGLAGLGWLGAGVGGLLLAASARSEDVTALGFALVFLVFGLLTGLVCALPRLIAWRGREGWWVGCGVGFALVVLLLFASRGVDSVLAVLLAPELKARVSYGFANGLLLSALPALILATLLGLRMNGRSRAPGASQN